MSEEELIRSAEELFGNLFTEELSEQLERESRRYSRALSEEDEARMR